MNIVMERLQVDRAFAGLAAPLASGASVRGHRIDGVIGRGGFGVVYRAIEAGTGRVVALKEYLPAQLAARRGDGVVEPISSACADAFEAGLESFVEEGALLRSLRDPGLVEVFDAWAQNGTAYLAMRLYDGATLDRVIAATPGGMSADALRTLVEPLLGALSAIHAVGRVHRDVSPDNVIVGAGGAAVLLDLGSARRAIGDRVRATTVMLKAGYAPIEQYGDDPDCPVGPWSDVYALGAVLHHAATGEAPAASPLRVMRDTRVPLAARGLPGVDAGFAAAVDAAMAVRPEERPKTIAEFALRLGLEDPRADCALPAAASLQRAPLRRTAPAAVAGASIGALLFVVSVLAWLFAGRPPAAPDASSDAAGRGAVVGAPVAAAPLRPDAPAVPPAAATPDGGRADAAAADGPRATAPRSATLRLAVSPWAEVRVDGARRGVTPPLMTLQLPPGVHRVELHNPAAAPVLRTVEVRAGQTLELMHRFDAGDGR